MNTQQIVELFEDALWKGQNPSISEYINLCSEEQQQALFLILEELQDFHSSASQIEISDESIQRIKAGFQKAIGSPIPQKRIWTIKRFFTIAKSLGKQLEDFERAFGIPIVSLKQLANDLTPLVTRSEFGREQRFQLSKRYSLDVSIINKLINRIFTTIRIYDGHTVKAFTRSREGNIEHLDELRDKLIDAIFQDDSNID